MKREIKYSFLLPYYDRHKQFVNTLESFITFYQDREDFEIIVVEDQKNVRDSLKHSLLLAILEKYSYFTIKHLTISEVFVNPSFAFNKAAKMAEGKYLIISSPECKHETNILKGLDKEFKRDNSCYVVCACQSLKEDGSFHMWYQHSIHRNACYHFCSAISVDLWSLLGGFDEAYKNGYCFDDDDFRDTIEKAEIPVIARDNLLVSHQWHSKAYRPTNWRQLWERNKAIYEKKFGKIYQEY